MAIAVTTAVVASRKAAILPMMLVLLFFVAASAGGVQGGNRIRAAARDVQPTVRRLLQVQADEDIVSAAQAGNAAAVRRLIDGGADLETRNAVGGTPLIEASFAGHAKVVALLLNAGADVLAVDNGGFSALHSAAQGGHLTVLDELFGRMGSDAPAAVDLRTQDGLTPLILAADFGHTAVVDALVNDGGADVEARDSQGATALYLAAQEGHLQVVDVLLAAGADPDGRYLANDATPLVVAAQMGRLAVADALLAAGADATASDRVGATPLHVVGASPSNGSDLATSLLAAGAVIDVTDSYGRSPADWAARFGNMEVLNELIAEGAGVTADTLEAVCGCRAATGGELGCHDGWCSSEGEEQMERLLRNLLNGEPIPTDNENDNDGDDEVDDDDDDVEEEDEELGENEETAGDVDLTEQEFDDAVIVEPAEFEDGDIVAASGSVGVAISGTKEKENNEESPQDADQEENIEPDAFSGLMNLVD